MEAVVNAFSLWSHQAVETAVNSIWLGLLLTGGVWAALKLHRRTAASVRYLVWWVTLLGVLLLPLALELPLTEWLGDQSGQSTDVFQTVSAGVSMETTRLFETTTINIDGNPIAPDDNHTVGSALGFLAPALVGLWLIVLFFQSVRLARSYRGLVHIKKTARTIDRTTLDQLRIAPQHRFGRAIRLCASDRIDTPMAAGFIRPMVILPQTVIDGMLPSDLRAIVRHELSHLARWDDWTKLGQKIIEAIFVFHPAVHLISGQLELERELACDEAVVLDDVAVDAYARSLTRLAQLTTGGVTTLIPGALTGRKQIFRRFERLLLRLPSPTTSARKALTAGLYTAAIMIVALVGATIAPAVSLPFQPAVMPVATFEAAGETVGTRPIAAIADLSPGQDSPHSQPAPTRKVTREDLDDERDLSDRFVYDGDWEAEFKRLEGWIHIQVYSGRRSVIGFTREVNDFTGLDPDWEHEDARDVTFWLKRDAGVIEFRGDFYRGDGEGEFAFKADESYLRDLADLGFSTRRLNDRELFHLALFDVSRDFIRDMTALVDDRLDLDDLVSMRIHDVRVETVREYVDLGYDLSADELIQFHIHNVTPEFISDFRQVDYKDLPPDRLVQFRIHDVDPDDIAEFAEVGLLRLSTDDLIQLHIHDVTPEFVTEMARLGYDRMSMQDLVRFRIHNVSADMIRDFAELGYDPRDEDILIQFRIHGVTPSMVREFHELGYDDLDEETLVQFKIHNVTPRFVKQMAEVGYDRPRPDDLVAMRIHDVSASYVRRLERRGMKNLSVDDLIEFRIHGID